MAAYYNTVPTFVSTADATASQMNTLGGAVTQAHNPPFALVGRTANKTIPTGESYTTVDFDTEVYDTDSFHDNATNNSRLTLPYDGYYVAHFTAAFANSTTGDRACRILQNGSTVWAEATTPALGSGTALTYVNVSTPVAFNGSTGDYIEAQVWQTSGGNLSLVYTAPMRFSIRFVGEA